MKQFHYPSILQLLIPGVLANKEMMIRGLVIDLELGNIVKCNRFG